MNNFPITEGRAVKRALVLSGGGGRGAFECGVFEGLSEAGWKPDLLIGTSIGAMNSAVWAISGTKGLSEMWDQLRTRDMHRFRWLPWKWKESFFDRAPWKRTLERFAPEAELAKVTTPLYIVTTNVDTGHPAIYTNHIDLDGEKTLYHKVDAITHRHLLASSSIPYVYKRTPVAHGAHHHERSDAHWDGALMYNSPLRPAIDAGANEIIVVLLSPYHESNAHGHLPGPPKGLWGNIGYVLDMALIATFENDFEQLQKINLRMHNATISAADYRMITCALIGPDDWITPLDIVRYRSDRISKLREMGYKATEATLKRVTEHGWDSMRGM